MRHTISADIRPSAIAGTWYPGNPDQLRSLLDQMLNIAPTLVLQGQIQGLIVPHAGYRYSGAIAARAFKLLQGTQADRVVVIAPMHHPYPNRILISGHTAYTTPLGDIPIDREALHTLQDHLPLTAIHHDREHSLEIELPFLQHVLTAPFMLIPLMLRDQSFEMAQEIAAALLSVIGEGTRTLFVASSDLSHFYTQARANQLDSRLLDLVSQGSAKGIIDAERANTGYACGRGAIAAVLLACQASGADRVIITGYGTSADVTADTQRVVGYGSAVIYQA